MPPSNEALLSIIYTKNVCIFSIINDLTPHQQYKDMDILFNLKKFSEYEDAYPKSSRA